MIVLLALIGITTSKSQIQTPAHWSYGIKKVGTSDGADIYEVHLLCTLNPGWHVYAQKQMPDAVAIPTRITFSGSDMTLIGTTVEKGKKEIVSIKDQGITNCQYEKKVDFIQKITVKKAAKEIKGEISYQCCTNKMCLPENTINFTIPIK